MFANLPFPQLIMSVCQRLEWQPNFRYYAPPTFANSTNACSVSYQMSPCINCFWRITITFQHSENVAPRVVLSHWSLTTFPNQSKSEFICIFFPFAPSPLSAIRLFAFSCRYCVCYTHEEMRRLIVSIRKDGQNKHVNCACTCGFCADGKCIDAFAGNLNIHWLMDHMCCPVANKLSYSQKNYYDWRYFR